MTVVPFKFERVLADRFRRNRLGRGFEHWQFPGFALRRLPRLAATLSTFIVTQGARAGISQKRKRVPRNVPVFPLNLDTGPSRQIDFDRFWVSRGHRNFSIAEAVVRRWSFARPQQSGAGRERGTRRGL